MLPNNPLGYVSKAAQGIMGRKTAQAVINSGPGRYAKKHPIIAASGGMMAAGGIASGRRRSGLDKVQGRPTGIYGY